MSAKTRRKPKSKDCKSDQVTRLAGLYAGSFDLIQKDQRSPEMVVALFGAHQLFKENNLGYVFGKPNVDNLQNKSEQKQLLGWLDFLTSLKEGDVWKLREFGAIVYGEHQFFLPQVCDGGSKELYHMQLYAELFTELLAPMVILLTGLRFVYVQALDHGGNRLRILSEDWSAYDSNVKYVDDELAELYEFEFEIVKT
jgi:hypothetical protein